jgi:transposase
MVALSQAEIHAEETARRAGVTIGVCGSDWPEDRRCAITLRLGVHEGRLRAAARIRRMCPTLRALFFEVV